MYVVTGKPYVKDAAQAKLMASETATFAAHQAIQILGMPRTHTTLTHFQHIISTHIISNMQHFTTQLILCHPSCNPPSHDNTLEYTHSHTPSDSPSSDSPSSVLPYPLTHPLTYPTLSLPPLTHHPLTYDRWYGLCQ